MLESRLYICASFSLMSNQFICSGLLLLLASCSRYSKVTEVPRKDQMEANPRVYGQVGQPARQSKVTYPPAPDAAAKAAAIHDRMFGGGQDKALAAMKADGAPAAAVAPAPAAIPADSQAVK
jgi:hypothetical protein